MPAEIQNVLLHMGSDPEHIARFEVALRLAREHGAHLEIAYMTSPAGMPAAIQGRGASAAYIAEATEIAREKAELVRQQMIEGCKGSGVEWTWEILEGDHNQLLAERSLFADVIIVSQDHGIGREDEIGLHAPDELITLATCPVMMLPKGVTVGDIGRRILIAWKEGQAAAHAVRRSRGFLQRAERIHLLTCDQPDHRYDQGRDIVGFLDRRGISVEHISVVVAGEIGETILTYAADLDVDLIVMGAHGRSRLREILTGSTTSYVLEHARVPVLTSH